MQTKIFFAAALLLLLFVSWKPDTKQNRIKTKYSIHKERIIDRDRKVDTTELRGGVTYTYNYNSKGELISTLSSDGSKTTYIKEGDISVSTITKDAPSNIISQQTDFLNERGNTDFSFVQKRGSITSARKIIYNVQGKREDRVYETEGNTQGNRIKKYT